MRKRYLAEKPLTHPSVIAELAAAGRSAIMKKAMKMMMKSIEKSIGDDVIAEMRCAAGSASDLSEVAKEAGAVAELLAQKVVENVAAVLALDVVNRAPPATGNMVPPADVKGLKPEFPSVERVVAPQDRLELDLDVRQDGQEEGSHQVQFAQVAVANIAASPTVAAPAFVPPPAPMDQHVAAATIGTDGVVHVSWAPGAAPVVPLTAVPMVKTERPPPPPAPGLPVGASAAPWTPPTPIAWEWPKLPPKGMPAPVFVPGQPPVTVEKVEQDDVEDILQPGDVNDARCPEAGQTGDDESEPGDLRSEVRLPGPPAPPRPAPVVQAPHTAPAKLGDPSRDPNRRAARFVPDTAAKGSAIIPAMGSGEPRPCSVRETELRAASRPALRSLLSLAYKVKNYGDLLGEDVETMVRLALDHEAAKGWITRDFACTGA